MDGRNDPAEESGEPTTSHAERSTSACEQSSGSDSTAQKRNIDQEILELLQSIHDNGKRQIELLEALASSENFLDEEKHKEKRRNATEKGKEVARLSQEDEIVVASNVTRNFYSILDHPLSRIIPDDEDDKLSKIIILGIMGAGASLLETSTVTDQSWDFLRRHFNPWKKRVMKWMGIKAPGGPNSLNLQRAWDFIIDFVGSWKAMQRMDGASRNTERSYLEPHYPAQKSYLPLALIKHTIRVFSPLQIDAGGDDFEDNLNRLNSELMDSAGLQMSRITGGLKRNGTKKASQELVRHLELTEKRIGLMMITTLHDNPPDIKLLCLSDRGEAGRSIFKSMGDHDKPNEENRRLDGIAFFQDALVDTFETWNEEWEKTMNAIDAALKVQLEDILDPTTRMHLMFESTSNSKFEQSETYFFVIQLLRIASDWITEATVDLEILRANIHKDLKMNYLIIPDKKVGYALIEARWKDILGVVGKYKDGLLETIEKKREEVYSLREALFNATSVREATKGTHINEYILVFTVMTILYLPLGFVATLYSIEFFKADDQKVSFIITISAVSMGTYLVASGLLYGVRQRRKKGSYREILGELKQEIAVTIGYAAKLSLPKKSFDEKPGSMTKEYGAKGGIPEHLKKKFFHETEQDAGASENQQSQMRLKYDKWIKSKLRGQGSGTGTSAA
ncbi:hypothetical protein PG987_002034 [Apiospora arundinis]